MFDTMGKWLSINTNVIRGYQVTMGILKSNLNEVEDSD